MICRIVQNRVHPTKKRATYSVFLLYELAKGNTRKRVRARVFLLFLRLSAGHNLSADSADSTD